MTNAIPVPSNAHIEAYIASACAWLMWLARVIAALGAPRRSRRLHRFVQALEREVESILFLQAVNHLGPVPRRRRFPRSAPPGFRRKHNARLRLFFRNAGVRARKASLFERLAALAAALANPEPHIAYFLKRLIRGLRTARLLGVAPPAATPGPDAPHAAATADTS